MTDPLRDALRECEAYFEEGDDDEWYGDEERRLLVAVQAALRSPRIASDEWQPIESAPRDGSHLLLARPDWKVPWHGFYRMSETSEAKRFGEGWGRTNFGDPPLKPTHWQPLPDPPAVKEPSDA